MALTGVTYRLPYLPVQSMNITPISGNFAAGTWDFYAVVSDQSVFGCAMRESPPVIESSVSLNGSQGVQIDIVWDGTHGASEYCHIYAIKDGTTYYYLKLNNNYNGIRYPSTSESMSTFYYYSIYAMCLLEDPFPYGLDNQQGAGVIQLDGNIGTLTIKQILDDMETAGYANTDYAQYNGYNTFNACWSLRDAPGGSGTLDVTGFSLWLFGIKFSSSVNIVSYKETDTTHLMSYKSSSASIQMYLYNSNLMAATISDGCRNLTSRMGSLQVAYNSNSKLTNCMLFGTYVRCDEVTVMNNCTGICNYYLSLISIGQYTNPFTLYGYLQIYSHRNFQYYKDWKILVPQTADYQLYYRVYQDNDGYKRNQKFLDCQFIDYESTSDFTEVANTDYPTRIRWYGISYGYYQKCRVAHTCEITVLYPNGNGIEGAQIIITDKDSNEIANDTTDVDGYWTDVLETRDIHYIEGEPDGFDGSNWTLTNYFPFTIIVSKEGYDDNVTILSVIDSKIDLKIAMVKVTSPVRIEEQQVKVRRTTKVNYKRV